MIGPLGAARQREAARRGHAVEGWPEEPRVGERKVARAKRLCLIEAEALRSPAHRLIREARGQALDSDSLPVQRLVEEDRVRAGGVDGMPTAEERADVLARPVSEMEIGATGVIGDDPSCGNSVALHEDPFECLLVAVAADVDPLDVRPRDRPLFRDSADERGPGDIPELAVVAERGGCVSGAGHHSAQDRCEDEKTLHHCFTT